MNQESIDKYINDILNGSKDLPKFNQPEHAGVCSAGPLLIGALIVCYLTRESLSASCNASGGEGTSPSSWQIDEAQEKALQQWAESKGVWIPEAEQWLATNYGPSMAQGAEAIERIRARMTIAKVNLARNLNSVKLCCQFFKLS